jgi:ubiquinol oxidase
LTNFRVFFNSLFISYIINPRVVHRFVGKLEEEAVRTYTFAIEEIEKGNLPEWSVLICGGTRKGMWRGSC